MIYSSIGTSYKLLHVFIVTYTTYRMFKILKIVSAATATFSVATIVKVSLRFFKII